MVLYVIKWNVHPDKGEAYAAFAQRAIAQTLAVPSVAEFRGYRPASGSFQVVITYEFADMAAWAAWYSHDDVQQVVTELRTLATDVDMEVWGPSPVVPQPIRPGG
jgi:quinol monooxygenase YgiN